MAASSQNLWVAILGILVAGTIAFVMVKGTQHEPAEVFSLRLRALPDLNLERLLVDRIGSLVTDLRLINMAATGQGGGVEGIYQIRVGPDFAKEFRMYDFREKSRGKINSVAPFLPCTG